jgi:hydroxyacylglutathione hydrolase
MRLTMPTPSGDKPIVIRVDLAWFGFLNTYIVRGERTILVDAGYPFSAARLRDALQRHGIRRGEVSLLLLTHGHIDHLGGAREMREVLDAPIALHRLDVGIATSGKGRPLRPTGLAGRLFRPFAPQTAPPFTPDLIHDGELDLTPFGVSGRTIPTPGHTAGSISVVLADCVLAGDLVSGGFVRASAPNWPYFAEDLDALRGSIRRVALIATGPLYVGHRGPIAAPEMVRKLLGE